MGESNGIFNLNLFKISLNEDKISKVIWKNIDILDKNNDNSRITKITMKCVDYMGLEKKENIEINTMDNTEIKNEDDSFNYNNNSTSEWDEMIKNINPENITFDNTDKNENEDKIENYDLICSLSSINEEINSSLDT